MPLLHDMERSLLLDVLCNMEVANADTAKATTQPSPELLSLPPIAVENILRSASSSGAIAACSCRALRDAWRELTSSNPEFAATALVNRFQSVEVAAEHLYTPDPIVLGDPLVRSNIAAPAPGLLDAVASPLLSILSALLKKRSPLPNLGYLTATAASDVHSLALLRHLSSPREGAGREADPAATSQTYNDGDGEDANQGGPIAGQEQAVRSATPLPSSLYTGAAFAGHEATVVELLGHGADAIYEMLPGAVRAGNARLCAALLEGGRMAGAASGWSTAAGGDVHGISGNPSGFVDSYASSEKATLHIASIYYWMLPLTYIGGGGGGGGGSSISSCRSSASTRGSDGGANTDCAGRVRAQTLLQRAVGGWCSGGVGPVQPAEDVVAAMAAARAAAEHAADTALGGSNPLLPLFVQYSPVAGAAAAATATAAALTTLTPPEATCGGSSSSSSSRGSGGGGGDRDGHGGGSGGGGSRAHTPGQACASLSTATDHAAVRQLLLQWRPAGWQAPPPRIRAAALSDAAMTGAWPVVSELLRAGVDPRDTGAPATLLYLALVQGRGAMAAWLLLRLLLHPINIRKRIVGATVAALVTRIMGIASPLQLLLRYKPVSLFEEVLFGVGDVVVHPLYNTLIPLVFLPKHLYLLWALYGVWAVLPKWRR